MDPRESRPVPESRPRHIAYTPRHAERLIPLGLLQCPICVRVRRVTPVPGMVLDVPQPLPQFTVN